MTRALAACVGLWAVLAAAQAPVEQGRSSLSPERRAALEALSPEEQARAKRNLERWRALPPEEKAALRETLQAWKALPPDERQLLRQKLRGGGDRDEVRQRLRAYLEAHPERRGQVKENLRRWRELSPEQRRLLRERLRTRRMAERQSDGGTRP